MKLTPWHNLIDFVINNHDDKISIKKLDFINDKLIEEEEYLLKEIRDKLDKLKKVREIKRRWGDWHDNESKYDYTSP